VREIENSQRGGVVIIMVNLMLMIFSLVLAIRLALKGDFERCPIWLIGTAMFYIAYSTSSNFSDASYLRQQLDFLIAINLLNP
jgi:hypothetical protein